MGCLIMFFTTSLKVKSKGNIRQIIDIAITNDTAASQINEVVVTGVAADGIMLLYPISRKM